MNPGSPAQGSTTGPSLLLDWQAGGATGPPGSASRPGSPLGMGGQVNASRAQTRLLLAVGQCSGSLLAVCSFEDQDGIDQQRWLLGSLVSHQTDQPPILVYNCASNLLHLPYLNQDLVDALVKDGVSSYPACVFIVQIKIKCQCSFQRQGKLKYAI